MTQNTFSIEEKVQEYYRGMANKDHRYRSWEHCYRYFRTIPMDSSALDKDTAALHLGFYLASWGMYRGGEFPVAASIYSSQRSSRQNSSATIQSVMG